MTNGASSNALLAARLFDLGAVQFGDFTLHSGRRSPIYMDLRLLVAQPDVLRQATAAYRRLAAGVKYDLLAAVPYGGLPIGVALALALDRPLIYPRKEVKAYGAGRKIEGRFEAGQQALLVEDLITSGQSVLQGAEVLRQSGLAVTDVVVLIDREQGGRANLAAAGIQVHAVMTLSELLAFLVTAGRLEPATRDAVRAALELD